MSLLIATLLGFWGPIHDALIGDKQRNWDDLDAMMIHITLATVLIFLHLWIAVEAKHTVMEVDEVFLASSNQ